METIVTQEKHSVCVILRQKGTDLILGVSRKDNHNDMGFPGGKVDPGENPIQAIVREVKEETGLDIVNIEEFFSCSYDGYIAHCYVADYSGTISYDKETEGRVEWVTRDVLVAGSFGDYNQKAFYVLDNEHVLFERYELLVNDVKHMVRFMSDPYMFDIEHFQTETNERLKEMSILQGKIRNLNYTQQ